MHVTLIMAILLFPILSALPIASASPIAPPELTDYSGPVGTKVTVLGIPTTPGGLIKVYWDTVKNWDGKAGFLAEGYAVGINYAVKIVIPKAVVGDHYVIVKDVESIETSYAIFAVDPKIALSPDFGIIGDTIAVTGTGFAEKSKITLWGLNGITTVPATVTTDILGSFSCIFEIPEVEDGTYIITARDEDDNSAIASLLVGKYITLTPEKGVVGTTVTVAGRGFTADGTVDIRWYIGESYITLVDDAPIDQNGDFSTAFKVPLVPDPLVPTLYLVLAVDNEGLYAGAYFKVVKQAAIKLVPNEGYPKDPFDVIGEWFTEDSTVTITFNGVELAADVETDEYGRFAVRVAVPEVSEGTYTVTAIDEEAISALATYTVLPPPVVVIKTRAAEYLPGDHLSIYGKCSEPQRAVMIITDPDGVVFSITLVSPDDWQEIDGWYMLPYFGGMGDGIPLGLWPLPSDAPLGNWNFTAYKYFSFEEMEGVEVLDTNLFTVLEKPSLQMVLDRLDELEAHITSFVSDAEGNILAVISTAKGDVLASLEDIDAKVTDLDGDAATISTALGELTGKVTSIEDDVATIETDVGTLELNVADLLEKPVLGPELIYVTIVFAVIAALGAIGCLVMLRGKLA